MAEFSNLDFSQCIQHAFDEETRSFKQSIISGSISANISALDGIPPDLGQHTSASSLSVVIASDQSPLSVQLISENIEIGKVDQGNPAPLGDSWPIRITDGLNIITFGQQNSLESLPVVIANDQSPITVLPEPDPTKQLINKYNKVNNVINGITTSILTYTVPNSKRSVLEKIAVSGDNIAKYDILLNGDNLETKRTYFGSSLNADFDFTSKTSLGTVLNSGDELTVNVVHNRPYVGSFEARLQVVEF